jgi:acetolactate synthase-1/2/3 large subunit
LCYDSALLEEPLHDRGDLPGKSWAREHSRIGAEKDVIVEAARRLLSASNPVIIADLVGRYPECVETLVQLAELLAAPVVDLNGRFNFPNIHPLSNIDNSPLGEADVILALDVKDLHGCLAITGDDGVTTTARRVPEHCMLIHIGTNELQMNGWSQGFQRFQPTDLSILADTRVALPQLLEECKIGETGAGRRLGSSRREERMKKWSEEHQAKRTHWRDVSRCDWDSVPMTPARMVSEVWEVIQHKDWVLAADTAKEWARRLWAFDKPYRHPGRSLGTGAKIGISLGVALAHKGSGKLVVDLQPDGDLMYDASSLWVAAHHRIPMLVVMYNNRSYYRS